jgi:serine/threonine-protein kinase
MGDGSVRDPVRELLPILVADLAEASARDSLLEVARSGGEAWVPLVAAPTERARHLLEVYTPDGAEVLRLIAEPLGPPSEHGFPLRLHLLEVDDDTIADASPPVSAAMLGAGGLVGRSLAGGKLEIEASIGSGAIGAVYRARHRDLQIPVAVKVLDASLQHDVEFCQRFYAEALAASRLDHPNLVRVFDYGQEADGLLYFSMELLDGITLRSLLARGAKLSVARIVEIGAQVCAGLAHAHGRGILHRRVAPENVMLVPAHDDEGRLTEVVKVCDFGLALGASAGARGAPEYMAPEQCRGEDLDERADVYGCGILLFELATGRVPFSADKPIVVVNRQLSMPPPPIADERPDLDPRLERVVHKALEKSRDRRHASMRELRAELKALLGPADPIVVDSIAPPPASMQPEWLEERSAGYARFLGGMASSPPAAPDLAEVLAHDPRPWLSRLVDERDPRAFAQPIAELDRAVRVLAHRADAKTLWAVSSALHGLVSEPGARGEAASKVLHLFADPGMLGPVADRLLAHDDDAREAARTLVVRARVAGAYALYGARVKRADDPRVRAPFVETMQRLGEHAWPVVRAALERIPATALTGEHPRAAELAEDLLSCVPAIRDEAAGHLVATYARATVPPLCRAAARALARLWAEGARPLLLELLTQGDEGACMAAVAGLREIGAVDEHAARHLAPLVAPGARTSGELRLSALAALGAMTADARPIAVPALVKALRDPAAPDAATVLAAARALVAMMGREAMAVIHERADASPEPLRSELRALGRSLPPI